MWRFFFKVHLAFFKVVFNASKTKNVECVNAINERRTFLYNFLMHSFEATAVAVVAAARERAPQLVRYSSRTMTDPHEG